MSWLLHKEALEVLNMNCGRVTCHASIFQTCLCMHDGGCRCLKEGGKLELPFEGIMWLHVAKWSDIV